MIPVLLLLACGGSPDAPEAPAAPAPPALGTPSAELATWMVVSADLGQGLHPEPAILDDLARRGCEGGIAAACTRPGWLHDPSPVTMQPAFAEACADDHAFSCAVATLLPSGASEAEGQVDRLEALCGQGVALACGALAGRSDNPFDPAAHRPGCEAGWAPACLQLSASLAEAEDVEGAEQAVRRGCELGDPIACVSWAGTRMVLDEPVPVPLLADTCAMGHLAGCAMLLAAQQDAGTAEAELALGTFNRLCRAQDPIGCTWLAQVCADGHGPSCLSLGLTYLEAWEEHEAQAASALGEACRLGEQAACARVEEAR